MKTYSSRMVRRALRGVLAATAGLMSACAGARQTNASDGSDESAAVAGEHAQHSVHESMSGHLAETAHMRMTPRRGGTPSDTARANEILAELRQGIAGYTDYRVALADGYRQFLPGIPQKVYHFTNYKRAVRQAFSFDASKPTSLLYESLPDGGYKLVGAMYTAPARASAEKLDARVPLSIGQWHLHTDLCFPPRNAPQRFSETGNGKPLFGPKGSIITKAECDDAGGRFFETLFGWMLHVNPYENDAASVWGSNTSEMKH